jgi:hypothetical protein
MMRVNAAFRMDSQAEVEGVWITIGADAALKIARAGNPEHRVALDDLRAPYRALVLAGVDPPEDAVERIAIQAMARTILRDWRGLADDDGGEIAYSAAAAERLLTELPEFRDLVSALSADMARFRAATLETARKN